MFSANCLCCIASFCGCNACFLKKMLRYFTALIVLLCLYVLCVCLLYLLVACLSSIDVFIVFVVVVVCFFFLNVWYCCVSVFVCVAFIVFIVYIYCLLAVLCLLVCCYCLCLKCVRHGVCDLLAFVLCVANVLYDCWFHRMSLLCYWCAVLRVVELVFILLWLLMV